MTCNMKKIFSILILLMVLPALSAGETVTFILGGNYMDIEDSDFGSRYGEQKYFPEGKLSLRFSGNLYLWASFGYFATSYTWDQWSNKGIPIADVEGKSVTKKSILAGGLGYYIGYLTPGQFSVKLELGVCSIRDDIEDTATMLATDQVLELKEAKKSAIGFRGNLGVTYGLFGRFFAEVSLGYIYAPDKIDDERLNLGGLRASLGLGIRF